MRATMLAALLGLHAADKRVAAQDCYDYWEETACAAGAGCDWLADSYCDGGAAADACYDIYEETPCTNAGCDWESSYSCADASADASSGASSGSSQSSDPGGGGGSSNSCPAGTFYGERYSGSEMQHTAVECIACVAGQYSDAPGHTGQGCIDCPPNTYVDVTGSDEASDCIACPNNGITRSRPRDPDSNMAGTINAAGTPSVDLCTGCADGTSYRNTTHTCTPCPFPKRCVSGLCTEGAQGDGCGMCQTSQPRYYAIGQLCQPCPESTPWLFIIGSIFVTAGIVVLMYKVAEVHDTVIEDAEAVKDALSDAKSAVALASSIYRNRRAVSIYITIITPHLQLLSTLIELDLGWPGIIKKAARVVADFFSFDFGSPTTPECFVKTEDPQTLFLYKFAATHCGFVVIVVLLLVVAGVQSKLSGAGSFRKMMNTINAVSISFQKRRSRLVVILVTSSSNYCLSCRF
jgi:hypothetical protein